MMLMFVVKILGLWILLVFVAVVNGVLRDKLLVSLIGQNWHSP